MTLRSILLLVVGISFLVVVITVAAYAINFHDFQISKEAEIWGTFGDYFGGVLNPIIGILNLVILIYILIRA